MAAEAEGAAHVDPFDAMQTRSPNLLLTAATHPTLRSTAMGRTKVEPDPTKPETCGFEPGTSEHFLTFQPPTANSNAGGYYTRYKSWKCSCDYPLSGRMVASGKAGKSLLRFWRQHLEAQIEPNDEILAIGVVKRARVQYEVFVLSRTYSGANEFATGHAAHWTSPTASSWHQNFHYGIGLRRLNKNGDKVLGCSIHGVTRTKAQAIVKANDYILKAKEDGAEVVDGQNAVLTPPPMKQETSFVTLLTRIDEATNLLEIEDMLNEVNGYLGLVPVLEARRQDLLTRRAMVVGRMLNEPQAV